MNCGFHCLAALLLGVLTTYTSGCATAMAWDQATRERGVARRVVAIEPPEHAGGTARLLVEYKELADDHAKNFEVIIPLEANGQPAYPFGYAGHQRDVRLIAAELAPEQIKAIEVARLAPARKVSRGKIGDARRVRVWYRGTATPFKSSEMDAMIYSTAGPIAPTPPPQTTDLAKMRARMDAYYESWRHLAPGEVLLLLPRHQRRPRSHTRAAYARAALATPVTLALDAVELAFMPLGIAEYLLLPH